MEGHPDLAWCLGFDQAELVRCLGLTVSLGYSNLRGFLLGSGAGQPDLVRCLGLPVSLGGGGVTPRRHTTTKKTHLSSFTIHICERLLSATTINIVFVEQIIS